MSKTTMTMTSMTLTGSRQFGNNNRNYMPPVRVHFPIWLQTCRSCISEIWELERFQTANVTFKVTQGHSIGAIIDRSYMFSY